MTIELWQIAQARRALNAFCSQHRIYVDEATAIKISDQLLHATNTDVDDPEQLYHDLRQSVLRHVAMADARHDD